jgi:hypothetical protein
VGRSKETCWRVSYIRGTLPVKCCKMAHYNITVFWNMMPCSSLDDYQHFRKTAVSLFYLEDGERIFF